MTRLTCVFAFVISLFFGAPAFGATLVGRSVSADGDLGVIGYVADPD